MRVQVRLFAILREAAGADEVTLDLSEPATVASLAGPLLERFPLLKPYLSRVAYAVNRNYAAPTTELREGDEVALIPPVSGGGRP